MAIGTNLSALWILIANGWMQNPGRRALQLRHHAHGGHRFRDVLFNPVAQAKFVHTVSAGYVTGAVFVLAISAYYLLRGRHRRVRQALDDGRRELRAGLGAVAWSCWATRAATPPA